MPTLQKGGGPMCACGHTKGSHAPGECVGCTGPDCDRTTKSAGSELPKSPALTAQDCTCTGVGLRVMLARMLDQPVEHAPNCATVLPPSTLPFCHPVAPEGLDRVDLLAAMSGPNPHGGCPDAGCGPDCPARIYPRGAAE